MAELGVGYISVVPEISKINPEIRKALGEADPIAERSGKSMGGKLATGIGTALKRTAVGTGVAAGGLIATGLTKGFGRLDAIEGAQSKLTGLGNSAETVAGVMDSALNAVKGTAHGLGEAATVASQMVASGIKPGEELEQTLKTVGDTAAIAGRSMEDVGLIFGSVAARGKLQGDDMLQLMSSGIPVLQLLSEELGVTSEEVSDMVSEGKVDFATFEAAMRDGMGGAALEMGDTFRGALANMGAATGRVGATALEPFFDLTKDGFGVATEALDNFNDRLGPQMDNVADWLQNRGVPALKDFAGASKALYQDVTSSDEFNKILGNTADAAEQLWSAGKELLPVASSLIGTLGQASAALGISGWTIFVNTLEVAGAVLEATAGPLEAVADFLEDHPGLVMAAVGAWGAFKTLPGITSAVTGALNPLVTGVRNFGSGLNESIRYAKYFNPEMGRVGSAVAGTRYHFESLGRSMGGVKGAIGGVVDAFGGPWALAIAGATLAIGGVITANKNVEDAQERAAQAARDSASAQKELEAAVAGTTGALSSQAEEAASKYADTMVKQFTETGDAYNKMFGSITGAWSDMGWQNALLGSLDIVPRLSAEYDEAIAKKREDAEASKALNDVLSEMGITQEDLSRVVAEGGSEYDRLIDALGRTGDGGERASAMLQDVRGEIDDTVSSARELDPAVAEAAAGIDVLADSSSTADEKLSGLHRVLQAMGLAPRDAALAARDAADAVDEIVEAAENAEVPLDNMGDALIEGFRAWQEDDTDWSNSGWSDLSRTLQDLTEDMQNVATNGGDLEGTLAQQDRALDALAEQYGVTREQIDEMARAMGYVPSEVQTLVGLEGADETMQQLALVEAMLGGMPVGHELEVQALTDDAVKTLEGWGFEVEKSPDGKEFTVTAKTDDALKNLDKVVARTADIKSKDVRIRIWQEYYTSGQAASTSGTSVGQHYALGGRLPTTGPGADTVDGFLGVNGEGMPIARVDAGEWVINRRNSARYNRELQAINDGTFPKLPGYAKGGVVTPGEALSFARGNNVRGQRASRSLEGAPYVFAGINWGDCSAAMSAIARFAYGLPAMAARFATGNQREALNAMGAFSGLGSGARFSMGWLNGGPGGGHTSGTIHFGDGRSVNVEMGGGRGNGQIGGNAAPASHPQYTDHAHIPLRGGEPVLVDEYGRPTADGLEIDSTSVDGYTTKRGTTVSWGAANELYDQALDYAKRHPAFANGGRHDGYRLPTTGRGTEQTDGFLAVNHSGMPIARVDAGEWIINGRASEKYNRELAAINAGTFPKLPPYALGGRVGSVSDMPGYEAAMGRLDPLIRRFEKAVDQFYKDTDKAHGEVVTYGSTFGGDWLGQAEIVRDAEQGLLDLRRQIAEENDNVVEREEALAEARKELREAEKDGGGLSVSQRRKLADAEEAVAKARKDGKPDKIADAEKRLARAREDADAELTKSKDKNAETVKRAQDKVNKAEDDLAEAREVTTDQSIRLVAAERTIAAARYQAAGELASGAFDALSKGATSLGEFFNEMARLAEIVENTRQAVAKLQMQQQMNAIERLRALNELQVKEWDVTRTRHQGAISVAQAEADLEDARELAALKGATGIEAMSGAMDRFRETGKFAVGDVAQSVIDNSKEVKSAEWAVYVARAQAALDSFEATRLQAVAQLEVAQATLNQTAAAEMLQLQTIQLEQQTAQLYGMTANQATGASKGFSGLGKLTGGLGKIAGGILAGLAGFAVGGPVGALAGAGLALGGLGDVVKGGIDVATNKDDMKDAWKGLDLGSKAGIILGGVGGLAAGVAGGAGSTQFGPEFALGMADIGGQITEATIGSVQYNIAAKIDKIQRDSEDRMKALQDKIDKSQFQIDLDKAQLELDSILERDRLEADLEYGKLMRDSFTASSEKVAQAYRDAAESEAKRAGIAHDEQIGELTKSNEYLDALVELTREGNEALNKRGDASAINGALANMLGGRLSSASAGDFIDSRIR